MKFNSINIEIGSKSQIPALSGQLLDGFQKTYTTNDGKNKIILSNKFFILEISAYDTFERLISYIKPIIFSLNQRKTFTTERIGLRYINIFNTEKIKILKKFFISEVANALTLNISNKDSDLKTIRSMHLSEYSMGNSSVNFRFGLYNKLYPNPIQTNDFVLDYDCFSTEGFSNSDDIIKFISEGHDLIQNLFEGSITNSLREFMKHG